MNIAVEGTDNLREESTKKKVRLVYVLTIRIKERMIGVNLI